MPDSQRSYTAIPLESLAFNEEGGETAAVQALLEKTPVAGCMIAIDALHTTRNLARAIKEIHDAD